MDGNSSEGATSSDFLFWTKKGALVIKLNWMCNF